MQFRIIRTLTLSVVLTFGLVSSGCDRQAPIPSSASATPAAPNPSSPVQWQYAELSSAAVAGKLTVRWEDTATVHETSSYLDMATKLGYEKDQAGSKESSNPARDDSTIILNQLGKQGWELVAQTHSMQVNMDSGSSAILTAWTFKKPQ